MKIVGGSQASHGQFPWQVIILKRLLAQMFFLRFDTLIFGWPSVHYEATEVKTSKIVLHFFL